MRERERGKEGRERNGMAAVHAGALRAHVHVAIVDELQRRLVLNHHVELETRARLRLVLQLEPRLSRRHLRKAHDALRQLLPLPLLALVPIVALHKLEHLRHLRKVGQCHVRQWPLIFHITVAGRSAELPRQSHKIVNNKNKTWAESFQIAHFSVIRFGD